MLLSHVQKQGWIFNPDNNNDTIAVQACDAWDRIQAHITGTPITTVSLANHNTTLHIKREDLQVTGSFKARGAMNYVMVAGQEGQLHEGAITSSTGNHALGCVHAWNAHAAACNNSVPPLQIYVPATTVGAKLEKLQAGGADVVIHGRCVDVFT